MQFFDLFNEDLLCEECGHYKDQHGIQLGAHCAIAVVICNECSPYAMRGYRAMHQINNDEHTIDIVDRYLMEITVPRSCWSLAGSGTEPVKWSPSLDLRIYSRNIQERILSDDVVNPKREKHALAALQQHLCCGCQRELPSDILEIDHIIPKSKGGVDQANNIQLLCPTCNKIKGNRDITFLRKKLIEKGIIRPTLLR